MSLRSVGSFRSTFREGKDVMSVSLEKINPVVRAVRIHTLARPYAWIDVRQHMNTRVTVGYRSNETGRTRYMESCFLDWERVLRREMDMEYRAGNLSRVETLCGE